MSKLLASNTHAFPGVLFCFALVGTAGCSDPPTQVIGTGGSAQSATGGSPAAAGAGGTGTGGTAGGTGGTSATGGTGTGGTSATGGTGATGGTTGGSATTGGSGGMPIGSGGMAAGAGGRGPAGGRGGQGAGASAGTGAAGASAGNGGSAGGGMAGATSTDCSSFLLCDDFEGAAPGAATSPWKVTMGSSYKVEVVSTPVHGGTHALHINAPSATGNGYVMATKGFPATDFWGRAYVRVKSAAGGHQCLMALNSSSDQVRVLNEMGSGEYATNLKSSDKLNDSKTKVPQDTWFCFEWHQSPTALHVYADGKELTDAAATWSIASISSFQFGLMRFQAGTGTADIYYYDVAVNTTQIGGN